MLTGGASLLAGAGVVRRVRDGWPRVPVRLSSPAAPLSAWSSPPDPLSAWSSPPDPLSAMRRGGTKLRDWFPLSRRETGPGGEDYREGRVLINPGAWPRG